MKHNDTYSLLYLFLIVLGNYLLNLTGNCAAETNQPKNVLLLMADDLGKQQLDLVRDASHSYNTWLDQNTVEFTRIVADTPVCAPSRAAMLTGRTNDRNNGISFDTNFLVDLYNKDVATIFGLFAQQGYATTAIGKIDHPNINAGMIATKQYTIASNNYDGNNNNECGKMKIACIKSDTLDSKITADCIKQLTAFAKNPKQPFFLGCGLHNPHYPWRTSKTNYAKASGAFPIQYTKTNFDQRSLKTLQTQTDVIMPIQAPQMDGANWIMNGHNFDASATLSGSYFPYLNTYKKLSAISNDFMNEQINYGKLLKYLRGAMLTMMDNQYKIIKAAYSLGLEKNTIIVITGDHGIGYGQMRYDRNLNRVKGHWSKNSLMPELSYIPLFFYVPNITNQNPTHKVTRVPGSIVDIPTTIYPLIFNKPMPSGKLAVDGKDLTPWITNPNKTYQDIYTISQYPIGPLDQPQRDPLMNSKVQSSSACNPNNPDSGRSEWCNMRYKIDAIFDQTEYSLHVIFPFYEQRACFNPKFPFEKPQDKLFADGIPSWQILPESCYDSENPKQMMLFSNQSNHLGANLLINGGTAANKELANKMLNMLNTERKYKACKGKQQRPKYSKCV